MSRATLSYFTSFYFFLTVNYSTSMSHNFVIAPMVCLSFDTKKHSRKCGKLSSLYLSQLFQLEMSFNSEWTWKGLSLLFHLALYSVGPGPMVRANPDICPCRENSSADGESGSWSLLTAAELLQSLLQFQRKSCKKPNHRPSKQSNRKVSNR